MITTLVVSVPLAAALLAVTLLALLQRRRLRRLTSSSGLHQVLGDAHASWVVDHALKTLVEACHREPRLVPGVVMVVLHDTTIAVHVSSPTAHPPTPWRTSADGLVWTADIVAVQAAQLAPTTANPYTGLVTLGVLRPRLGDGQGRQGAQRQDRHVHEEGPAPTRTADEPAPW